eukprot:6169133-Amphidinium_carterae.1
MQRSTKKTKYVLFSCVVMGIVLCGEALGTSKDRGAGSPCAPFVSAKVTENRTHGAMKSDRSATAGKAANHKAKRGA